MDSCSPIITPNPMHNNWILGDWIELSDAQFVSPPTSIRNIMHAVGYANWKPPNTTPPIPNGRFTFSSYFMPPGWIEINFRLPGIPIYPSHNRSYYLKFGTDIPTALYRYESPTTTLLGTYPYVPTPNGWNRLRLAWIQGCTGTAKEALAVLLEQLIAGSWVVLGSVTDPENKWRFAAENRFAFALYTDADDTWCYLDDTRLELVTTRPFIP